MVRSKRDELEHVYCSFPPPRYHQGRGPTPWVFDCEACEAFYSTLLRDERAGADREREPGRAGGPCPRPAEPARERDS